MRRAKQNSAADYCQTEVEGISIGKTLRKNDETNPLFKGSALSRFTLALCKR
jgi:hypothetical protein